MVEGRGRSISSSSSVESLRACLSNIENEIRNYCSQSWVQLPVLNLYSINTGDFMDTRSISICPLGSKCFKIRGYHFYEFCHPHLDDILNQCGEDIEIPTNYSSIISREILLLQLKLVKYLRSIRGPIASSSSDSSSTENEKTSIKRRLEDHTSHTCKRSKGDILEKIKYSEPYRFFLSSIAAESKTHDEMLSVSFSDLFDEKLGVIESSLQITFVVEIDWLLAQYAVNNEGTTPITLLYGYENSESEEALEENLPPHVDATYIKHELFGSHHSKMMILSYTDGSIRVIITTGNLIEDNWENTTQGIWISPRLLPTEGSSGANVNDSETNFKQDLLHYLEGYRLSCVEPWIEKVKNSDCREVKVFFIASTPGSYLKSANALPVSGLMKMTQLLSEHAIVPNDDSKNWPLHCQCSSIGSLAQNKDSSAWLLGEFTSAMQSASNRSSLTPNSELKLIYPCFEDIMSSYDSLAAGNCLRYEKKNYDKQSWLKNYLCKWRSDSRFRTRAMPHIKTYCRISPCQKYLSWFLLTSANLSKAAWGYETKNTIKMLNYEAGVLFIPQNLISKSRLPLTNQSSSEDGPLFPLPYDRALTHYTEDDMPWLINHARLLNYTYLIKFIVFTVPTFWWDRNYNTTDPKMHTSEGTLAQLEFLEQLRF